MVEDILKESQAAEQEDGDSTAAAEKLPAESQAFEVAVRGLVDPNGNSGSSLEKVVELVADVLKSGREAEVKLESETVRFDRAIEDLGHEWMDKREQFDFIINGQNDMVYEKGVEANRLFRENTTLLSKNSKAEKKLQDLLVEYNGHLRTLVAEKRYAEDAEKKALNEVEDRINVQRRSYEKERSDGEFQHLQEMNSQICSKRMVQDEFKRTQDCLLAAEKHFQKEMRRKDRTIQDLEADVSRRAAAVAAEEEHAHSSKQRNEQQLEEQRKKKDGEISVLSARLREIDHENAQLRGSLSASKSAAESARQQNKWWSDRFEEETESLRGHRDYLVADLNLDIKGLSQTIKRNEAEIDELRGKINELQSGTEIRNLGSQLRKLQRQLQKSANEASDLKQQLQKSAKETSESKQQLQESAKATSILTQQLQKCKKETKELQASAKVEKKKSSEDAEKAAKELSVLTQQLQECRQKTKELQASAKIEEKKTFENAEKAAMEKVDYEKQIQQAARVSKEAEEKSGSKGHLAKQLEQAVALITKARRFDEQKIEFTHKLEVAQNAEQTARKQVQRLQIEKVQIATEHEAIVKKKEEEVRRLRQDAQDAKDAADIKSRETEREQKNTAVEKAAQKPAQGQNSDSIATLTDKEASEAEVRLSQANQALNTNENPQKGSVFQELHTANRLGRDILTPRAPRRLAKPRSSMLPSSSMTNPQDGSATNVDQQRNEMPQPQNDPQTSGIPQNNVSTSPSTGAEKDFRQPFADILASLDTPKVSDSVTTVAPPEQAITAPLGWTDEMTMRARDMDGEDIEYIAIVLQEVDGLTTNDEAGLQKWLEKISADFHAEQNQTKS